MNDDARFFLLFFGKKSSSSARSPLSAPSTSILYALPQPAAGHSFIFIVEIDNVGSMQLQQTRMSLRGTAEVLMGKNTMMRKCIREFVEENPDTPIAQLEACCRGNVGFVFTNGDLGEIRECLESNVRPAPAK